MLPVPFNQSATPLDESYTSAALLLLDAHQLALQAKRSVEDFAISVLDFRHVGLTDHHFRRLVVEGNVKIGVEQTRPRGGRRQFRWLTDLSGDFSPNTYFVLTAQGVAWAEKRLGRPEASLKKPNPTTIGAQVLAPCWVEDQCELWHLGSPVLAYAKLAPNPFCLFEEFEKRGWPGVIENPFCPDDEKLRNTVKKVNSRLKGQMLYFVVRHGGQKAGWKMRGHKSTESAPHRP